MDAESLERVYQVRCQMLARCGGNDPAVATDGRVAVKVGTKEAAQRAIIQPGPKVRQSLVSGTVAAQPGKEARERRR